MTKSRRLDRLRGGSGGNYLAGGILACLLPLASIIALSLFPFPVEKLDRIPASPRVTARDGRIMMELVGRDDQWRFPVPLHDISPWIIQATMAVEDQRFRSHAGVDPAAVTRAMIQNLHSRRVVSGASTITMQVARMMDNRPRTWKSKLIEAFRALQLERLRGKDQIMETYLNLAPYGGNVRGVEAASRLYFAKRARDLSLAEAALLAGLPQSPTRFRPDRYPQAALARRNQTLDRMKTLGMIAQDQWRTAREEEIALNPKRGGPRAVHAAWLTLARRPGGGETTIDLDLQRDVERLAREQARSLPMGSDLAVVVIDIADGSVAAMLGSLNADDPMDGQVNGALARRSPGSALKPFIYAAGFESRRIAPDSILHDAPIDRAGWEPENFDRKFHGTMTAAEALRRSLNVPAILVAEKAGIARCFGLIEAAGIRMPQNAQSRTGLAFAVGACEVTLLDLTNGYATLGRGGIRIAPRLFTDEPKESISVLNPNVCAAVDEILSSRARRPNIRGGALANPSAKEAPWFMWKTGTSAGRRDAWAVGHNHRYAVGVWVGRFAGAGEIEYVGAVAAEPLLASIFSLPSVGENGDPNPALPIFTDTPRRPVIRSNNPLRIVSPRHGATFLAVGGQCPIYPRAEQDDGDEGLTWFINGRYLAPSDSERLALGEGRYELRCADTSGHASAVRFEIH